MLGSALFHKMPILPGHAHTDELLAALVNPATAVEETTLVVPASPGILISSMANRRQVVIIMLEDGKQVWVKFGTDGDIGMGCPIHRLGGVWAMSVAANIPIHLVADAPTSVYILQVGG